MEHFENEPMAKNTGAWTPLLQQSPRFTETGDWKSVLIIILSSERQNYPVGLFNLVTYRNRKCFRDILYNPWKVGIGLSWQTPPTQSKTYKRSPHIRQISPIPNFHGLCSNDHSFLNSGKIKIFSYFQLDINIFWLSGQGILWAIASGIS